MSNENSGPKSYFDRVPLPRIADLLKPVELPDDLRIRIVSDRHLTEAGRKAVKDGVMVIGDVKKILRGVGRRIGDTSDLPEALLKQLSTAKLDDLEEKIIKTIRDRFEGVASIDEIMVGLFRDFEYVTEDRRALASKLYRMTKAGHLESVPKRKGVMKIKE